MHVRSPETAGQFSADRCKIVGAERMRQTWRSTGSVLHGPPATAGAIRDFDGKRLTERSIAYYTGSLQRRALWQTGGLRDVCRLNGVRARPANCRFLLALATAPHGKALRPLSDDA